MPRKTDRDSIRQARSDTASMRPRPDAAENNHNDNDHTTVTTASMRPRPDAAENQQGARQMNKVHNVLQ